MRWKNSPSIACAMAFLAGSAAVQPAATRAPVLTEVTDGRFESFLQEKDSMGFGLFVGDRLLGHGGLIAGFSSQFVFDRETRSLIVVFSNDATGNPQQVVFGLLTILLIS
jgi:hypothetical protein